MESKSPSHIDLVNRFGGYLSGDGLNYILGFAIYGWLVHVLTNQQFGELSIATNIYQVLMMFVALGLDLTGPRILAESGGARLVVTNQLLRLRLWVAFLFCGPLIVGIAVFYVRAGKSTIAILLLASFAMILARTLDATFLAVSLSEPLVLARTRVLGLCIYLGILFISTPLISKHIWLVPLMGAIGMTVGRVWLLRVLENKCKNCIAEEPTFSVRNLDVLLCGLKASSGQFVLLSFQTMDVVLLSRYVAADGVGQYAMVSRLYLFGTAVLTALLNTFLPELMAAATNRNEMQRRFKLFFVISLVIGVIGGLAFVIGAQNLCEVLAHRILPSVGSVAPIFGLTFFSLSIGNPFCSLLPGLQREGSYLLVVMAAALTLFAADLFLIPHYGTLGAAWGQLIATCVLGLLSAFAYAKQQLSTELPPDSAVLNASPINI